jgi:cell division transport system permease protein
MWLTIRRSLAFSWQHFWRNVWLSLATVTVVSLMLFAVTTTLFFRLIAEEVISSVQDRVDISVYLKKDVQDIERDELQTTLTALLEVKSVTVVTPEEALQKFRERYQGDQLIIGSLDALEENPLTSSLVIKAEDPEQYAKIMERLDQPEVSRLIEERDFEDNQVLIERIVELSRQAQRAGIVLVAIFAVIGFLVVFNTLRVAIYTYREEIGIMKLVGATNAFVRLPFFLEQIWYGLLSTVISTFAFAGAAYLVAPRLSDFIGRDDLIGLLRTELPVWFAIQVIVAIVLCVLSGAVAIRRYLKV